MSDDQQLPPGPPPSTPPPPPSTPDPAPPASGGDSNRTVMLVLSYLWVLALVPFLLEKEDREVQWHAKHGLVLTGAEFAFWIVWVIAGMLPIPFLGCISGLIGLVIWAAFVVVHVLCIVKATNGERFLIPGLSDLADQF